MKIITIEDLQKEIEEDCIKHGLTGNEMIMAWQVGLAAYLVFKLKQPYSPMAEALDLKSR